MAGATMKGGKELAAGLRALPDKIRKQYARSALKAGGEPMRREMVADINSKSGLLASSIKVKVRVGKKVCRARVGPSKAAFKGNKQFYADWVDEGHFTGSRPKRAIPRSAAAKSVYARLSAEQGRKFIAGTHFADRALESAGGSAAAIVVDELKTAIENTKLN